MTSSGKPSLTIHSKTALPLAVNNSLLLVIKFIPALISLVFSPVCLPTSTELGLAGQTPPQPASASEPAAAGGSGAGRRLASWAPPPPRPFPLRRAVCASHHPHLRLRWRAVFLVSGAHFASQAVGTDGWGEPG